MCSAFLVKATESLGVQLYDRGGPDDNMYSWTTVNLDLRPRFALKLGLTHHLGFHVFSLGSV